MLHMVGRVGFEPTTTGYPLVAACPCRWPAGETQGSLCARMRALCLLAPATIIGQAKLNRHDHRPEIKDAHDLQVACFSEIALDRSREQCWSVALGGFSFEV